MVNVVTIYHSGYGHTKKQAEAVDTGIQAAGAEAMLIAINAEGTLIDSDWETP